MALYGYLNGIKGITIESKLNDETFETTLKNFKYGKNLSSSTINTRCRNLIRNLTNNAYSRTIITQDIDITKSQSTPKLIPNTLEVPKTGNTYFELTSDIPIYQVIKWTFENVPRQGIGIPYNTPDLPLVTGSDRTIIKFRIVTSNYEPLNENARFVITLITTEMYDFLLNLPIVLREE